MIQPDLSGTFATRFLRLEAEAEAEAERIDVDVDVDVEECECGERRWDDAQGLDVDVVRCRYHTNISSYDDSVNDCRLLPFVRHRWRAHSLRVYTLEVVD